MLITLIFFPFFDITLFHQNIGFFPIILFFSGNKAFWKMISIKKNIYFKDDK